MSFIIISKVAPSPMIRTIRSWCAWVWKKNKAGTANDLVFLVTGGSSPGNVYRRLYASHRDLADEAEVGVR